MLADSLDYKAAATSPESAKCTEQELMVKMLKDLRPGAALLPKECLNVTAEEWRQVEEMISKEKEL